MISAFIWCIYCLSGQKIVKFPKLMYVSDRENFTLKLEYFWAASEKNCWILGIFQVLCRPVMMSAVIWDHFWLIWPRNVAARALKVFRALSTPPRPTQQKKKTRPLGLRFLHFTFVLLCCFSDFYKIVNIEFFCNPVQPFSVLFSPFQSCSILFSPVQSCSILFFPVLSCPLLSCSVLLSPAQSCSVPAQPFQNSLSGLVFFYFHWHSLSDTICLDTY